MSDQRLTPMTHREILQAMTGLLLAMFVAMVSSTIVASALPRIVADLNGTEAGYTWVIVASLLATSATTPIWGKLSDLFSKKMLIQVALGIFVIGSVIAGFATSMPMLIAARVVQGVGAGGAVSLVQVVIGVMVSPRERGRYAGYIGATFAAASVSGPIVGGIIVDTAGWRWCFGVAIPIAFLAFVVLQKTLNLPVFRRKVKVDYLGATLLMSGISALLVWVSLAGSQFAWTSGASLALIGAAIVVIGLALYVETKVSEPIIPLHLFRDRTTSLASISSLMIGAIMMSASVFLTQYFQIVRGMSPTNAGLMSIATVGGLTSASLIVGRLTTRTGKWKRYVTGGLILLTIGTGLLATVDHHTNLAAILGFMLLVGVGIGMSNQTMVLAVQNNSRYSDIGAASSLVSFCRSLGSSAGVSVFGAVLGHQVASRVANGLQSIGATLPEGTAHNSIPDMDSLTGPVRQVFEHAYGVSTGQTFLYLLPLVVIALVAGLLIKEVPLRTTVADDDELEMLAAEVDITERLVAPTR